MPTVTLRSENDRRLGFRIKELRLEKGLKAKTVAKAIGKRREQLYKYEVGMDRVPASVLMEMAEVLRCDLVDFFGRRPLGMASGGLDDHEQEALELLRALDEERVGRALGVLRDLVDERDEEDE